MDLMVVDGSMGEGGGQILRSALALSLVTGKPCRIEKIRAGRKKPGLQRQHLTALQAATAIGRARVSGAEIGSGRVTFEPSAVASGSYRFVVGTAGSTTLVLQTILPALLTAPSSSSLILEGGTHNPLAPPFDFLQKAFLPLLAKMGARCEATLESYGFYPAGGGRMRVTILPAQRLIPLEVLTRGARIIRSARVVVANLPKHIAERELSVLKRRLSWPAECFDLQEVKEGRGPGNLVMIEIRSENVTEVFTAFGEKGVAAEAVAERALEEALEYENSEAAVGLHLADQLLLPLAVAGGGAFTTLPLTPHSTTNIQVLKLFLDVDVNVKNLEDGLSLVQIRARS